MTDMTEVLSRLDDRLSRIEAAVVSTSGFPLMTREWYSVAQAAELVNRKPFTVREWCRNGRVTAEKRVSGRGRHSEWMISADEIRRYENHGLLPIRR